MADTTYIYTGNDFNIFQQLGSTQPYNTSDFISGEFTVSTPLAPNLTTFPVITVESFSFTDGINTITNLSSFLLPAAFRINTDAHGSITEWAIQLETIDPSGLSIEIATLNVVSSGAIFDVGGDATATMNFSGQVDGSPGTWTNPTLVAAPEPSSLMFLATGLVGSAGLIQRRIRKT
jgi:hypothetical protein